jgi:hypothetical protein
MSSDLERRLEGLLADAPEPEAGAGEQALHRALRALRPPAPARRGLRTAVVVFATALVLLVIAAGSLAAVGALHVSFGAKAKPKPHPVTTQLSLPGDANGIAALVDGRLSVVIKGGFRLQGLPASAAALSPHALFVAAGVGDSLVAMAPDGRRVWSHPAGGKVVALAWAPDGFRIAYVVDAGRHFVLRVIYGNGRHDTVLDRNVRPVRPSWRADNLAVAYVSAGGRAVVYDLGHESRRVVGLGAPVAGVAFAPAGDALAVERPGGLWLVRKSGRRHLVDESIEAFGWLNGRLVAAVPGRTSALVRSFTADGDPLGSYRVHGVVVAVTPKLLVVRTRQGLVGGRMTLLGVPHGASLRDLQLG